MKPLKIGTRVKIQSDSYAKRVLGCKQLPALGTVIGPDPKGEIGDPMVVAVELDEPETFPLQTTGINIHRIEVISEPEDEENATSLSALSASPGSISWQRWDITVTYKWTFGLYSIIYHEDGYWNLRRRKKILFSHEDLQVVQEWAENYIQSNKWE